MRRWETGDNDLTLVIQLTFSQQVLLEPYRYLCDHPGKDVRAKLIEAFDAWLQVPPDTLKVITNVVQMLHTASLM